MILHAYSLINTLTQSEDDNPSFSPSLWHTKKDTHVSEKEQKVRDLMWRPCDQRTGSTECPTHYCRCHLSSLLPSPLPLSSHFSFSSLPFPSCPPLFLPCPACDCWHLSSTRVAIGLFLGLWNMFFLLNTYFL